MALQYLREMTSQRNDIRVLLGTCFEQDEGHNRQTDRARLDAGVVAANDAPLFHLAHSFGHRWRRKCNLAPKLAEGKTRVLLKGAQNRQPGAIKQPFETEVHASITYEFEVFWLYYLRFYIGDQRPICYDRAMDIVFLFKGVALGLAIAAPIGPIGILCVRRTLAEGPAYGLVSGLGAATADALYGMVAGFGLTFISSLLIGQRTWLNLIGGTFLCYLGVRTFASQPTQQAASAGRGGLLGAYASTLILTLTNPMTIMFFAAVFAGLGIANAPSAYTSSGLLVTGVFLGSALWWLALTSGSSLLLGKFSSDHWRWINRLSGLVLVVFGVLSLLSLA